MNEDMIFPEEGFPSMEELTAGAMCSNGAQVEQRAAAEGCAAACAAHVTEDTDTQKNALACGSAHESASHLAEGETPWLRFIKKYPRYAAEPLPEGMNEAVRAGEDPTMAFLRLENQRLEHAPAAAQRLPRKQLPSEHFFTPSAAPLQIRPVRPAPLRTLPSPYTPL